MTTTEQLCRNQLHPVEDRNSKGECAPCETAARLVRGESRVERLKRLLREAQPPERNWEIRGLCGGADPTDWLVSEDPEKTSFENRLENQARHERAKAVCLRCPVRKSCLDSQLLNSYEPSGTWGAVLFTSTDRDPLRRARKELASE